MESNAFAITMLAFTAGLVWVVTARFWHVIIWTFIYLGIYFALSGGPTRIHYNLDDSEILNFYMVEDEAIYLWIMGSTRPSYLEVNWSDEVAQALIEAAEKARKNKGDKLVLRQGFTYNDPKMFSVEKPKENPPKQR